MTTTQQPTKPQTPNLDTNQLRDHIQTIYERNNYSITPSIVLNEARNPSNPLHSHFEWDDSIAGEEYRKIQARNLIQSVKIKYVTPNSDDETKYVRKYVSIQTKDEGHQYKAIEDIAKDDILTEITLRNMEREWRQLKNRYGHFREFVDMIRNDMWAA